MMPAPEIEVLGVYRLDVTDTLFREQVEILYGHALESKERADAEVQCRAQLESVVLVETLVTNAKSDFSVGDFAHGHVGQPSGSWQAAWEETFLTVDGESVLAPSGASQPKAKTLRIAFFIHNWDPAEPLQTSYGARSCPSPQPMPERLRRLVPYAPVD